MLADSALLPIVEATRGLLRRDTPLFFTGVAGCAHGAELLGWIRDPRPMTPCPGQGLARLAVAFAAVAVVLAVGLLALVPGPGSPRVPAYLPLGQLVQLGRAQLDRYDAWFGVPAALAASPNRDRLERTVDEAEFGAEVRGQALSMAQALEALESGADSASAATRALRAGAATAMAGRALRDREEWTLGHPGGPTRAVLLRPWDTQIERAFLDAALLGLTPVDRGFGGFALPAPRLAAITGGLRAAGGAASARARRSATRFLHGGSGGPCPACGCDRMTRPARAWA